MVAGFTVTLNDTTVPSLSVALRPGFRATAGLVLTSVTFVMLLTTGGAF